MSCSAGGYKYLKKGAKWALWVGDPDRCGEELLYVRTIDGAQDKVGGGIDNALIVEIGSRLPI
jgi:hypothetical protein